MGTARGSAGGEPRRRLADQRHRRLDGERGGVESQLRVRPRLVRAALDLGPDRRSKRGRIVRLKIEHNAPEDLKAFFIEQIEAERAQGREVWDAVVEGAVSRFRPIMLTAISTVLGFIPIAPTVFWGPMAFAIMGGLFVATVLTLLVLPALYVIFFRVKEPEGTTSFLRRQPSAGPG